MEFLLWLSGLQARLVSMRMQVRSLASITGLKIWHCHELWCRPAATAPIQPPAQEFPYASGVALPPARKKEGRKGGREEGRKEGTKEGKKEKERKRKQASKQTSKLTLANSVFQAVL